MIRWFPPLALLGCLIFPPVSSGQEQSPPEGWDQNAALTYWQAFAVMPTLSESELKIRDQVTNGAKANEDVKKIVSKSENALRLLHRGARQKRVAWGTAWDEGPYALLPHLSKARELTRFAVFRAQVRFAEGQNEKAIEDLLATMTLGRHLSREGVIVLIPLLVDYAIEAVAIEKLAIHLPELDARTRANLKLQLADLPSLASLSKAMQGEKDVFLPWLLTELKKPNAKQNVLKSVGGVNDNDEIEAFNKLGDKELLAAGRRMGEYYDRMIAMAQLPNEEFQSRHDRLFQEIENNGAKDMLSRWLLPSITGARRAERQHLTRLALFQAGLAVLDDGTKALENPRYRDPFGEGPFTYRKTSTGFVLESKWKNKRSKKSLSLTFGKPTAK